MHPYQSFDPAAVVNGETLQALDTAFNLPSVARRLLLKHGLPAEPTPGQWYPLQRWLDVLAEVETAHSPETVYAVGLQIITACRWPAALASLPQAVRALDEACRANIQGESIGYYRVEETDPRSFRVECCTPTPEDFDRGLLTGMARRFRPVGTLRVAVNREPTPEGAQAHVKVFRIRW